MCSSNTSSKTKIINDNDVIQSIYANRKEKFDILGLEPNIKDREKEIAYFNNLTKNEKDSNDKKINHEHLSYYNTISTITKLGISQSVVFEKNELKEMCESKFGGGVIPADNEKSNNNNNNAFISRLPTDFNDENGREFMSEYDVKKSFHSWLQNSKNMKVPDLLSHLLYKDTNVNIETLMLMNEEELKGWSDNTNLGMTKQDTAELVDAFLLYKKYVNLFK